MYLLAQNPVQLGATYGQLDNPFYTGNRFTSPVFPYLNAPNFSGQMTLPNLYAPVTQFGNLNNFPLGVRATDLTAQTPQPDNSKCNPFTGRDCIQSDWGKKLDKTIQDATKSATSGLFGEALAGLGDFAKKFFLLVLAIVLVAFGLYFMAKSTDTGKIVIGAAKKVAA